MRTTGIRGGMLAAIAILPLAAMSGCSLLSSRGISDDEVERIRQQLVLPTSMYVHDYEGAVPPTAGALYPYHKSDQLAGDLERLDKAGYRIEFIAGETSGEILPPVEITISKPR